MLHPGAKDVLFVVLIALLLFGASRLSELGKGLGAPSGDSGSRSLAQSGD
jgi:Sec-independent protein translocase protein TatA